MLVVTGIPLIFNLKLLESKIMYAIWFLNSVLFTGLTAFCAAAQDFPVAVPNSFRTEVFFELKYDETFDPVQFMTTEFRFKNFQNYSIMSRSATTIQPEFVKNGLNLGCVEEETIVIEGKVLRLHRQSSEFQGMVPRTQAALEQLVEQHCGKISWVVSYATKDDLQNSLGRLHGLGMLIGSLELIDVDRYRFRFSEKNTPKPTSDTVTETVQTSQGVFQITLNKWHEGWRVARLETKHDGEGAYVRSVRETTTGLEGEGSSTRTKDAPGARSKSRMLDVQFSGPPKIALAHVISNGTPVGLRETPQIKAVWMDGKVVRVYEGGTVDDLGSATFRATTGSYGILNVLLITLGFASIGAALMWIRKLVFKVK